MIDRNRIAAAIATVCVGLALASAAEAVDLRSWDQKINIASKRFVVLASFNNEAVLDKETQLVWQRTPAAEMATSRSFAASICGLRNIGDRLGWRLPSFHEMTSLANPSAVPGSLALPAGHPFMAVPKGFYWTATVVVGSTSSVGYVVGLDNAGSLFAQESSDPAYFWCVRGGGPIGEY